MSEDTLDDYDPAIPTPEHEDDNAETDANSALRGEERA